MAVRMGKENPPPPCPPKKTTEPRTESPERGGGNYPTPQRQERVLASKKGGRERGERGERNSRARVLKLNKERKERFKQRKKRKIWGGLFWRKQMCTGNAYPFLFSGEWQRRAVGLRPTRGPDFYNRPGFLFKQEPKSVLFL